MRCSDRKESFGLWLTQTAVAKCWLRVMSELHTRGFNVVLIAVFDGRKGFVESTTAVFPDALVQTCRCASCLTPGSSPVGSSVGDRLIRFNKALGESGSPQPNRTLALKLKDVCPTPARRRTRTHSWHLWYARRAQCRWGPGAGSAAASDRSLRSGPPPPLETRRS